MSMFFRGYNKYKALLCNSEFQNRNLTFFSSLPYCLVFVVQMDVKNRKKKNIEQAQSKILK